MLQIQFILLNAHFTINLLTALVCFAISWLYFDAWLGRRDVREGTKMFGFLLLSISFVIHSTQIEQSLLTHPILSLDLVNSLTAFFKIAAYVVLIIGQVIDPLQPLPSYRLEAGQEDVGFGIRKKRKKASAIIIGVIGKIPILELIPFSYPVFIALTAFLYLRRATLGLEYHLRTIGYSFYILAFSELIGLAALFRETDNITLSKLVAPFGILWIVEHTLLIIFIFIIGKWVWGYLTKRLETQLFIVFTTVTLVVFLLTAIFFTSVSLSNLRKDILEGLQTNVQVLNYTISSKKNETLSDAQVIAQNPEIILSIVESNKKKLTDLATTILLAKKEDFLVVVNENGAILVRADDPEKVGGSLSDDAYVKKALEGESTSGIVTKEGVMAPTVSVRASTPIKNGNDIIGAVVVGTNVDNAFVDGLKDATGLDASVYAENVRSATTFVSADGKSRWVGIKEETLKVKEAVLDKGEPYSGSVSILNIPYLSAFTPLKNIDNNPVGMLFVGKPEVTTLEAAGNLIQQTFVVTVILLVASVVPAFFVSKYIIDQIK